MLATLTQGFLNSIAYGFTNQHVCHLYSETCCRCCCGSTFGMHRRRRLHTEHLPPTMQARSDTGNACSPLKALCSRQWIRKICR